MEAALAMVAVVLVFTACLSGLAVMSTSLRVQDAAREAARLSARGDDDGARSAVDRLAPPGSRLQVSGDGDLLTVQVTAGPLRGLLPDVYGRAIVAREADGVRS
ncbi:TadE family type IV pilus minor pilin [Nakamurella leprariae]|uniref:TadE family type IV pilus minor pilin n=1 Tax=Nakamurella leprariae TaxID=2803911 RepID=UPI002E288AFA|nr:TadE family type IV pilus minor pilin [Nakamurella leprariae]